MKDNNIAVVLFALTTLFCRGATEVNLSPPAEWGASPGAPSAPGDAFEATFTGVTVAPSPVIAEWSRYALLDETFTLTKNERVSKEQDGHYRFRYQRYEAVINPRGRLESLKVEGEEFLSPPTLHANAYGAALVGGPGHRTAFVLPDVRLEADMIVARGEGRELSYRFRPDGIDFLFDLPEPLQLQITPAPELGNTHKAVSLVSFTSSPARALNQARPRCGSEARSPARRILGITSWPTTFASRTWSAPASR